MKRTRQEKVRLGFLFVLTCCFFLVVFLRLVHLQVLLHDSYSEVVDRQSGGTVTIPSARGVIYDRNGRVMANNVYQSSVYAYPENRKELNDIARYIEKVWNLSPNTAKKQFGLAPKRFRWIKRMIDDRLAARIEKEAPPGLHLRQEAQRVYPMGVVGKQILGFTDIDNRGQSGLEYAWDSVLAGQKGYADIRRDGLRRTFKVKEKALVKPIPGQSVVLTLDYRMQEIVEEELRNAVEKYNAKSGMAAFIDCNNGDILAMAHFDPSEKHPERPVKLRAVTDRWEPGSIFKAFTAAALLDSGLVDFADSTYCEEGKWRCNNRYLHDDKELGWLNFRQIMELSSNIGVAKYAIELGGEKIIEAARRFGLGEKSNCGLPGETSGKVTPPGRWSEYNTAMVAIGHSVAVSALQMAAAFGAIANGGELLRPRFILGHVDSEGCVMTGNRCEIIRRTMERASADTLRAILRGVVQRGTAEAANSTVVSIAGKTGTAQIYDVENRRYFYSKYMASFAGFFPAEQPLVAGIVVIEKPHPIHYGGWTAAPAFRKIAERYAVLNPDLFTSSERILAEQGSQDEQTAEVPNLIGRDLTNAEQAVFKKGLMLRTNRSDGLVIWQYPQPDHLLFAGDEVIVVTQELASDDVMMLDLKGLSIREASAFASFANIKLEITGQGQVVKQSIRPGTDITDDAVCKLACRSI